MVEAVSNVVLAKETEKKAQQGGPAVLKFGMKDSTKSSNAGKENSKQILGMLAEWTVLQGRVSNPRLQQTHSDPLGCSPYKANEKCSGCAMLVQQGLCTFEEKAKNAEQAGAKMLVVAMAGNGAPVMMASTGKSSPPQIFAVAISKATGKLVYDALDKGQTVTVDVWQRQDDPFVDLLSEVFVGILAITLVVLGAFHSVEDLRHPSTATASVEVVPEHSGLHFVLYGSLLLTVLFFFMKYLIYVLILFFAMAAVSTTALLLEPVIAAQLPSLRAKRACRLPKFLASWLELGEEHSWSDLIAELAGFALAVAFIIFRNDATYGWIFQDIIAIMLLLTIQRSTRLPNLKVAAGLLFCTFWFDIFWVFLSPLIFQKSVMIEVATGGGTGQAVPMVLKIPGMSQDFPGQFKILGLGDIALPGLLISLLLRHDKLKGYKLGEGYFTRGVIGYAVGLLCTFISLYLMKHGQPALLFLVPGTLGPTCIIAHCKGEFAEFWGADYGPPKEATGEGENVPPPPVSPTAPPNFRGPNA